MNSLLIPHEKISEGLDGLGERNAIERLAHYLFELGAKLTLVGMESKAGDACPLNQNPLADALGLTAVHVNRVLPHLREQGLVTFHAGLVTLNDYDRLVSLAEFDPVYLDQTGPLLNN